MKSGLRIVPVLLLLATLATAASTRFVSTWRNPFAPVIDKSSMKMATFVMSADQSMRLGPEETLAAELRSRGVRCVAGYTVLPGELAKDPEKAKEFLHKAGITGAVIMRVVADEKVARPKRSAYWATSYYPTFWGYWEYGWTEVYTIGDPGSDRYVSIETLLYHIEQDKLIWAGQSETTNPKNVRKFAKDLVDAAGKEIRRAGRATIRRCVNSIGGEYPSGLI